MRPVRRDPEALSTHELVVAVVELDELARPRFTLSTANDSAQVQLAVHGEHQVSNALSAAAIALECGATVSQVADALAAAGPASRHRMEVRVRADGVTVINDAYNANPDSMRAGLQALPRGQYETADALGLSYWKKTGLIILPQALRLVIPPLVNTFIGFFKDTSLVLIIGIFDLLTAGKVALTEPAWAGYSTEVYLVLAAIYFAFCFVMARYSRGLEQEFSQTVRR